MEATSAKVQEENVSPSKLFAFSLKKKCLRNKEVSKVGKSIFLDEDGAASSQQHVPLQVASAIFESVKMSKSIYMDIRLLLKGASVDIVPTDDKPEKFRSAIGDEMLSMLLHCSLLQVHKQQNVPPKSLTRLYSFPSTTDIDGFA